MKEEMNEFSSYTQAHYLPSISIYTKKKTSLSQGRPHQAR